MEALTFVFINPALGNLVDRHWIKVMPFLPPVPHGRDEVRGLQYVQMLGAAAATCQQAA